MESVFFRRLLGVALNIRNKSHVDYGEVGLRSKIGTGVLIGRRSHVDALATIGSYSYVGYNTSIGPATVGRYVSIGNNVTIGPGEHDFGRVSTSSLIGNQGFDELTAKSCVIGNDVWIGVDAIVRRGVSVGDGAVIGANSFVRVDIPPYAVVAGSPARLIRYRFSEEIRRRIHDSRWWELELEEAQQAVRRLEAELFGTNVSTKLE